MYQTSAKGAGNPSAKSSGSSSSDGHSGGSMKRAAMSRSYTIPKIDPHAR